MEYLGHATVLNCISFIDDGVIYKGSIHGKSEFVRHFKEHLVNMQSYENLDPIKDMLSVDLERQGLELTVKDS